MSNEIKGSIPMEPRRGGAIPSGSPAGKQSGALQGAPAQGPAQEKVTLTDTAQKFARLSAEAAKGPAVDEAKVKALRAEIAAGRYQADPVAIADALIRFEKAG